MSGKSIRRRKVLVVDDEPKFRREICDSLEDRGFAVNRFFPLTLMMCGFTITFHTFLKSQKDFGHKFTQIYTDEC